ncbi:MAG TPA: acyl-CoA dehydrogenase family protein [Thermomicrobiales bacterium]|nr:acyl-CoA dehydrogenase family protein [Thermomicrobiales bacterium]
MDFSLSADDRHLVERARALAGEFATRAREYDEAAAFPAEDFARLREAGFLTLTVPEELGGHGMWAGQRYLPFYMILEAIATGNASTAQLLQIQSHASGIIAYLGNDEQRRRILGDVVARGALIASCGSETDPRQFASGTGRAELQAVDGGFRLTATKHFGSLAPAADYYVVYVMAPGARTAAEGYTTVVVSKDAPGVSLEDHWDTMGMRATISWSLVLNNVFVPWEDVLGQPGDWIQHDPRTFTLAYCANHLGTAQGVFDFVLDYLKQRPFLMNDDVIAYTVGEMDAALQATRTSLWYAAWLWEQGRYEEAELAGMRVLHTSKQMALMVTTKAFEVCGARAAFRHLPVERAYRDVRTFSLHFRESALLKLLAEADLGGEFHSKQRYGPKIGRQSWAALGHADPREVSVGS